MAKRFDETVNLQTVDTRTGGAQAALSLADRLEDFKSQFTQMAGQQAVKRGEASAAGTSLVEKDGVTQAPEFQREGFFGSIEAATHNKALKGAYLASLSNDINESVGRIEQENADNSLTFNDEIGGFSKGVLSGVDPSVRNEVVNFLDSKVIATRGRVNKANRAKDRTEAEATMNLAALNAGDNAKNSARDGDNLSAAESIVEFRRITQGMVEAGFLEEDEQAIKNRELEKDTTKEIMLGKIRAKTSEGDFDGVIKAIQDLKEKRPKGFTTEEHDDFVAASISELNESIALANKLEDEEVEDLKATQEGNYIGMTIGILDGTKSASDVTTAAKNREISASQMDSLLADINSKGTGINDWDVIAAFEIKMSEGLDMTNDILKARSTMTGAKRVEMLNKQASYNDPDSFLNTANGKSAKQFLNTALGPSGILDSFDDSAKKNFGFSIREYDQRVIAGEDPWTVADEVFKKNASLKQIGGLRFGNQNDLPAARVELDAAFDALLIDDSTYNREVKKIDAMQVIFNASEQINKARKDANAFR